MSPTISKIVTSMLTLSTIAVAQQHLCPTSNGTYPAAPWPTQHTRLEAMFTPLEGDVWATKPIWYDFDNLHYRADSHYVSGNGNALTTLYNFSSIWRNTSLFMITYADKRSLQPESCIELQLGITMMMPQWMLNGNCMGDVWVTHKSQGMDPLYYRGVWTRIPALSQDDGTFDWFSDFTTGAGLMMQAPGPDADAYVINEEGPIVPATFSADSPIFDLPSGLTCIPTEAIKSYAHLTSILDQHKFPSSALNVIPELKLAFSLAKRN